MQIPYTETSPADWDVETTLWVSALNELYNDMKSRRGRAATPPADPISRRRWHAAADRDYVLVDDGESLDDGAGSPITFRAGEKSYRVSESDFQSSWAEFINSETQDAFNQRINNYLAGGTDSGRSAN